MEVWNSNGFGRASWWLRSSCRYSIKLRKCVCKRCDFLPVDLPGVAKDDIDVNISNNTMTITAKKSENIEEEAERYFRRERFYGKVQRSIVLPVDADHQRCEAKYENGVLTINMPKLVGESGSKKLMISWIHCRSSINHFIFSMITAWGTLNFTFF